MKLVLMTTLLITSTAMSLFAHPVVPNAGMFGLKEHAYITAQALKGIEGVDGTVRMVNFIQSIHDSFAATENPEYYKDFQHFDNGKIVEGWEFVHTQQLSENITGLALGIHALQDFYSHSNFVELAMQYFPRRTWRELPLYEDALRDTGFVRVWEKSGTTGYVTDSIPEGKYRHGDGVNPATGLSKDSFTHPLFRLASSCAIRETRRYVLRWMEIRRLQETPQASNNTQTATTTP